MFKTVDVNNVWLWVVESWGYDGKYNEELLYGKRTEQNYGGITLFYLSLTPADIHVVLFEMEPTTGVRY